MLRNEALAPEFISSRDPRMHLSLAAMCSLNDGMPSPALGRQQLVTSQQVPPEMSMCQGLCRALRTQSLVHPQELVPGSHGPSGSTEQKALGLSGLCYPTWYGFPPVISLQGQIKSHCTL